MTTLRDTNQETHFNRSIQPNESLEGWAERFYKAALASGRLFGAPDGTFYKLESALGPRRLVTNDDLFGAFNSAVEVITTDNEGVASASRLHTEDVKLLAAADARQRLPQIKIVVTSPAVVRHGDAYVVTKPGLNTFGPGPGVYYHVPPLSRPIAPTPVAGALARAFSGIPFETPGHQANFYGWLLSAVVIDPLMSSPMMIVSGNQQSLGKTELMKAAGFLLRNELPSPIAWNTEELPKSITARFIEGDRYIMMDNVTATRGGAYNSVVLSQLLTQGFSAKLRVLGHSKSVEGAGLIWGMTVNDAKVSSDLSTRAIAVKLFREVPCPMVPFCTEEIMKHREQIYAELLGLALSTPAPIPVDADPTFRFRTWLQFVAPRVAQHFGQVSVAQIAELDDVTLEIFHLGADIPGEPLTVEQILSKLLGSPDRFPSLSTHLGNISSTRGRLTSLGRHLNNRTNKVISVSAGTTVELVKSGVAYAFTVTEPRKEPA
jgi:hypothetical protein